MTDRANPKTRVFDDPDTHPETMRWDKRDCLVKPISTREAVYIIVIIAIVYLILKVTFPQYIA